MKYDKKFYENNRVESLKSAKVIVPMILEYDNNIKSVVDVGCGTGTWLSEFANYKINDIFGIDGKWVNTDMLLISKQNFISKDLNERFQLNKKYDLAMSLEVAEHIRAENSDIFIDNLCDLSDTILFSAAIPNQFGETHINCNCQDYWVRKFQDRGYTTIDIIRNRIWDNNDVSYWYKQNIFIFKKNSRLYKKDSIYNIVHPELLQKRANDSKYILSKLFEEREYDAIIKLKEIYNPYIFYYLGRCYLEKGEQKDAIKYLEEFINESSDNDYKVSACYYLGIIYFNKSDLLNAKKYFEICNENSNGQHKMANTYLERIGK